MSLSLSKLTGCYLAQDFSVRDPLYELKGNYLAQEFRALYVPLNLTAVPRAARHRVVP